MKRVLMFWEAAADRPQAELEGNTPLDLMRGGVCSALVRDGASGWLDWEGLDFPMRAESTLALMLGVPDESARRLRRGPLEATAALGDAFGFAYRVNLVTSDGLSLQDNHPACCTDQETESLLEGLRSLPEAEGWRWARTGPARAVAVADGPAPDRTPGRLPHVGEAIPEEDDTFPARMLRASGPVLDRHPVNDVRVDLGENPANRAWLWGGGEPAPVRRAFLGAPLKARMVTNSLMAEGLARQCSMEVSRLPDPWADPSEEQADWAGWLADSELLVVYVAAPRDLGSYGGAMNKVKQLDRLDMGVLHPLLEAADGGGHGVLLGVVAAPSDTEVDAAVYPVFLWGAGVKADPVDRWNERSCREGRLGGVQPSRLVAHVVGD